MKTNTAKLFAYLLIGILSSCRPVAYPPPTTPAQDAPPSAVLEIGDSTQTAGIGTFCWNIKIESGEKVDMCVDKIGLPTVQEPIVTTSPVNARLILALQSLPGQLELSVFPATAENEVTDQIDPGGLRYWMPSEGVYHELVLQSAQDITLKLEPGVYVFYVFGVWEGKGDVSYGFLVEVK